MAVLRRGSKVDGFLFGQDILYCFSPKKLQPELPRVAEALTVFFSNCLPYNGTVSSEQRNLGWSTCARTSMRRAPAR